MILFRDLHIPFAYLHPTHLLCLALAHFARAIFFTRTNFANHLRYHVILMHGYTTPCTTAQFVISSYLSRRVFDTFMSSFSILSRTLCPRTTSRCTFLKPILAFSLLSSSLKTSSSSVRFIMTDSNQGGDPSKKTYHKKATGNALTTVKNHSKDDELKLYGSAFW